MWIKHWIPHAHRWLASLRRSTTVHDFILNFTSKSNRNVLHLGGVWVEDSTCAHPNAIWMCESISHCVANTFWETISCSNCHWHYACRRNHRICHGASQVPHTKCTNLWNQQNGKWTKLNSQNCSMRPMTFPELLHGTNICSESRPWHNKLFQMAPWLTWSHQKKLMTRMKFRDVNH